LRTSWLARWKRVDRDATPRWPVIIGVAVLVTVPLVLLIDAFSGWNMGS
jgi:hypothetical protein